jgi:hypothetical protein
MAKNDSRLLSGRVKTKSGTSLDTRRSDFLSLDNAEPNLGNPDSDRYILASLADGTRLFLNLNNGFIVNADSVSGDETTFSIDPSGLANAVGTTLADVLDDLDSAITLAFGSGVIHDNNFNGAGTVESQLSLDSDLRIFGITGDSATFANITRTGTTVTAGTYGSVTEIPVLTVDTSGFVDSISEVSISTTLNTSGETGTGSVSLLDSALNIAAGEGINTVASGNTVTVSGEDASTTNKGVAHFDSGDFTVSSGYVSVRSSGVGNAQLENDTVTIGSTGIALGETSTTLSGLTQVNTTNLNVTDSATIVDANITGIATINQANVTTLDVSNSATIADLTVDSDANLTHVYVSDLTDNRIVISGPSGKLEDDANFTFNGTQFDIGGGNFTVQQASGSTQIVGTLDVDQQTTLASVNVQDLTNDRLVVTGTNGELEDDANLTYNGSTLTVANNTTSTNSANGALVVTGGVGIGGALNVNGNTEIAGDLTVTGTTTTIEVQTLAIQDPLIHLADSNESGDEVDIGFVGHYYDAALGGRQHTGLFRDATDDKYYLFAQYQDSALDSSPRSNVIDRSDPSFILADFNVATIVADTFSGTVSADSITTTNFTATSVDINGGTIDGATIATSDITVGTGKTLDVSAGTLTLANDQISGDKVEGGTIDTVTVNNLTSGNVNIDGGNIDGATIATSDITVGAGKTLDVSAGTLTLADDQISGNKVEGGTINAVTINNLTSGNVNIDGGFIDGTAIGHTTPDSGTFTNLTRTSPAGVTAGAYGSVTEIPVITVDASGFVDSISEVAISTTLNTSAETGTGSVNLLDSSLEIAAGVGIDTVASGRTITISGEDASTSNKGVASFDAGDFSVSSGAVSIKTAGVGNDQLEFDSVTVTAGSGLTGGGSIALGSSAELKLDSAAVKGLFSSGANIDYDNSTGEIAVALSGVTAGVYGTSTKIPIITVDSYGQVDSIGLVGAQATLGDTVDSISHSPLTGEFRLVTDVATFFTDIVLDPYTTDSLSEGTTNLYYTKIRVDSDIDQAFNENPSFGGTGAPFSVANDTKITNLNADKLDGYSFEDFMVLGEPAIKTNGDVRFNDDVLLTFGQSNDLRIYHDQNTSYINEIGTGDLKILTNGQSIILEDSTNDKVSGQFTPSGSVDLYHNGSKKFETTNTGVDVTGNVVADGGTIDGQLFVNYSSASNPAILVTSTDGNSQASPELELYKNSTSANGHYLGQLKFTGENSTGGKTTYAKITGKILDNTAGTEDGIIEVAFQKAGSNNIAARFRSDRLDLINGTDLNVNGDIFTDSDLSANNITRRNTTVVAGVYGSVTAIPVLTVDASGFVDSVGTTALSTVLSTSAEAGTGSVNLLDSSLEIAAGVGIDTVASGNTVTVEIDSDDLAAYFSKAIVHDNTNGFEPNEHINHSGVSITAGKGLTGGGDITSSLTIDIDSANVRAMFSGGTGITYDNGTGEFTTTDGDIVHDNLSGFVSNEHIDHSDINIYAGKGLTGGGDITSSLTIDIDSANVRAMFSGGDGLTYNSGTGTFTVVGGDGITANANEIEVTVDGSTIELSATDGSGAIRVIDGGITNTKLENSSLTVGDTNIALGTTSTTLTGLTQVDVTGQVNVDNVRIDGNTISSTAGSYMYIDPHPVDSAGTLVILGNLSVEGTTTTIKSTTVSINDKNIVLADSASGATEANGAGITVGTYASNPTITYDGNTDRWDFNKPIEVSTVHGALSGNATTATTAGGLSSAVTVQLSGDVSGSATFTSAGDTATISTTIQPNSVELGTDTTGNYVASLTAGNLIDLQNNSVEGATPTIDVDLSELTDMTDAAVGADELVILDAGSQKRKAINEITLGLFNTANQIELSTDTTGSYVATVSGTANEIEVTGSGSENATVTVGLPNDVTVSNNLTVNNDIIQENHRFTSSTITRESTSQVDLDTFSATTYSGAEVNIMAISSGERHITKLLVVHDGTTAYATEYGSVYTNTPLATYDVDISGGNVRIRVTPASATNTVFNTLVTLIEN